MSDIKVSIRRHPILAFYLLTFVISWGGILLIVVQNNGLPATKEEFEAMVPAAIPALLGGPSIAGLLLTGLVHGRDGFRGLFSRLLSWRVNKRWYTAAILIGPIVLLAVLLALSFYLPELLPGIFASNGGASRVVLAITAGLGAGIFEELGWTGFAVPELRRRYGVLTTGLITGVLWGAWHIPANIILISNAFAGGLSPAFFITVGSIGDLVGILPAYRILMVWVYDRTGSLLVAMLMHLSLTVSTILFEPREIAGMFLVIYSIASAAAMWALVAAVAVALGWRFTRQLPGGDTAGP